MTGMQGHSTVKDLGHAAILTTLGVPISFDSITDVRTGKGNSYATFPDGLIPRMQVLEHPDSRVYNQIGIDVLLKENRLSEIDSYHDACEAQRALYNRERILDWVKTGKPQRLKQIKGVNRCVYEPSEAVPIDHQTYHTQWKTHDLKIAASLAGLGVPITRIVGTTDNHVFFLTLDSIAIPANQFNALEIVRAANDKRLNEDHPYLWGMEVQRNRERILDEFNKRNPKLYITRKGSRNNACSIVDPNKSDKELRKDLDLAKKHSGLF